jgi:hypothetical protein
MEKTHELERRYMYKITFINIQIRMAKNFSLGPCKKLVVDSNTITLIYSSSLG